MTPFKKLAKGLAPGLVALLVAAATVPVARAQNFADRSVFTESQPFEVGTTRLEPGTYLIRVVLLSSERTALQVTDPKEESVYFLSTEAGRRGRNLYRLDFKTGLRTLLTEGQYTHSITFAPDGSSYVDTASAILAPPKTELIRTGRKAGFILADAATPELQKVALPRMEPLEIDGCDALILKPADFDPSKSYPVLIYTYGGPGAQMTQNAWGRSTFLFHALLAQKGYIVFARDNRGSAGKGQRWEAELLKRFGQK